MPADDGYQWFVEQGGLTGANGQRPGTHLHFSLRVRLITCEPYARAADEQFAMEAVP